ncbi:hypothetical protein HNQ93_004352 [Hymenobacter luteus]|uniref:Probable sensor domain-containing protein n=2 Tax=Hymenobacter TaxID=89966 RepID=A0A7W9T4K5_9BACT|nr:MULTISPECIES: diadenylate cyclase [Hymenobacter]MBB4603690.1 hypothetical protein [Hymenobacter latericoloratus]MBB6061471.1 hypothetical protein [Hymenobacter luteus]
MHYYPSDLAYALRHRWPAATDAALPAPPALTQLISVAYQASLLSEEARPVVGQLVFAPAALLEGHAANQAGQHVLLFSPPRPYTEQELRRLTATVQQPGNLLAVDEDADGHLRIWGLLATHHAWDQARDALWTARESPPAVLLLRVVGPGSLVFYDGPTRVLTLQQGRVDGHGFVQFPVAWGRGRFAEALDYAHQEVQRAHPAAGPVPDELIVQLSQHFQRRIIARVRASGHGGLLAFIPATNVAERVGPLGVLRPKYGMASAGAGPRYRQLLLAIVGRLSELGEVNWAHYQQSADATLRALEAELGQFADLLADLMAVDGALLLTKHMEVVGFGVEVHAPHIVTNEVYRAQDLEASAVQAEAADQGGTRHRAAYRLCLADPDSLVVVVSQDGGVKFVHQHAGKVIFWDQL